MSGLKLFYAMFTVMLQRNLLYTAITRPGNLWRRQGSRRAVAIAVKNNRVQERCTALKERLAGI